MPISPKQKKILAFPYTSYDALICDGAVRSGKTSIMSLAFIDDAMRRYSGQRFGICGKTVDSTVKNIVIPYMALSWAQQYKIRWHRADKVMVVESGNVVNFFEIFGGKDESSFTLIQGRTLAGALFDEVALQTESFVKQAMARCSVEGAKLWFNCNPASPSHWFYKEWICKAADHNAYHLHFLLEDNPSLSEKKILWYKSNYDGVFYRRYILGEWCVAEGLVYDFGEENIVDELPEGGDYFVSIDYGTLNPFSAGLWCVTGDKAVRVSEYYYSGRETNRQLTDDEYCDKVVSLIGEKRVARIVVDPSAASFIAALRRRRLPVISAHNEVLDGIRRVKGCLRAGNIKIHRSCASTIEEFGLYRWDERSTTDAVIKEHDHAMDDIRYFVNTILINRLGRNGYRPLWL